MKRLILLIAVLTMTLVGTVPALAQGAASGSATISGDQSAENPTDAANSIRGKITSISGSVVLVKEDPADEPGSAQGAFTMTDETRIYEQQDDKQVAASPEDLEVGQTVLAAYAGAVAESYPTQGEAESIVILESSGDGEPRCSLPEGCGMGDVVVATALIEKAEATSYQYGTHTLVDGDTGETIYALTSESVDLDAYEGELVTIYSAYVPGYESGLDGGPPLVEVDHVETAPDGGKTVTASFELTVEGDPPAGTTFFGEAGLGTRGDSVRLEDPDGDGVYKGSLKVERGTQRGVWIEQGTSRVIIDFGLVTFDEDKTFLASISFKDGGSGDGGSKSGNSDSGGGSSSDGIKASSTTARELPKTGGAVLTLLGLGALLVAGGILTRRYLP